mgnify:CR=1 FL=1
MKLLLIEDDVSLTQQLTKELEKTGFLVDSSADGQDGLYRAREFSYDLIIVDIGLPIISGTEVVKQLREENYNQPILMLTARSSWQDKVYGLKAGADDYLVKPFQQEELVARIQALLRRIGGYSTSKLAQGPLSLDMESQEVWLNDKVVNLTAFEYKLIQYFLMHPNKVASKAVLADYLYDEEQERDSNVIEVIVARLRQKLDPKNEWKPIETLRGRGYRLTTQHARPA